MNEKVITNRYIEERIPVALYNTLLNAPSGEISMPVKADDINKLIGSLAQSERVIEGLIKLLDSLLNKYKQAIEGYKQTTDSLQQTIDPETLSEEEKAAYDEELETRAQTYQTLQEEIAHVDQTLQILKQVKEDRLKELDDE